MRRLFIAALAMVAAVAFTSSPAQAVKVGKNLKVGFQGQFWMSLSEDAQHDVAGGADKAFGFKIKRLRYSIAYKSKGIFAKFNIETAGSSLGLKDGFFGIKAGGTKLMIGQMRPATTQEGGMQSSKKLVNIERSLIARANSKGFFIHHNSFRDLGIFVKSKLSKAVQLHVSITNGVGAKGGARDVGGVRNKGYVTANAMGDVALVGAVVLNFKPVRLTLHAGSNKHDDAVVGKDLAGNIDRTIYGVSFKYKAGGILADGEYSLLANNDGDTEKETKGYYVRLGYNVTKAILLTVRYQSIDKSGSETTGMTGTLNWKVTKGFTLQVEGDQQEPEGGDSTTVFRAAFLAAI